MMPQSLDILSALCYSGHEHLVRSILLVLLASDEGLSCSLREVGLVSHAWNHCVRSLVWKSPSAQRLRLRLLPGLFKRLIDDFDTTSAALGFNFRMQTIYFLKELVAGGKGDPLKQKYVILYWGDLLVCYRTTRLPLESNIFHDTKQVFTRAATRFRIDPLPKRLESEHSLPEPWFRASVWERLIQAADELIQVRAQDDTL